MGINRGIKIRIFLFAYLYKYNHLNNKIYYIGLFVIENTKKGIFVKNSQKSKKFIKHCNLHYLFKI